MIVKGQDRTDKVRILIRPPRSEPKWYDEKKNSDNKSDNIGDSFNNCYYHTNNDCYDVNDDHMCYVLKVYQFHHGSFSSCL